MPNSVGIAAFVVGLGLLIAAIVGQRVKLISIELPDLSRHQRLMVGALGIGLTFFGLTETRGDRDRATRETATAVTTTIGPRSAAAPAGPTATGTPLGGTQPSGPDDPTMACIATVPSGDTFTLDVERERRTDRKPQAAMPRDAQVAVLPRLDGRPLGAIVYRTRATGGSFTIVAVYDATCTAVQTYRNASDPDAARDAVGVYQTVEFVFGPTTVAIMLAYGEGVPTLLMTGQVV